MAINVNLAQLSTLNNQSILAQTNTNNSTIQTALVDAVSRSGQSPNQMTSTLDMNGNQVINLPPPATINSPARLVDVTSPAQIASVPPVGTSGAVVPLLNGNNTWSGTNTFNSTVTVQTQSFTDSSTKVASTAFVQGAISTSFVVNVTSAGVKADGVTDDRVALQTLINATPVGGILQFPGTQCAVSADGGGVFCLQFPKPITLLFAQGGGIKPLPSVANTVVTLYFNGSASSSFANTIIDGCFVGDNSSGTFSRHGAQGIVFDTQTTGAFFTRPIIRNCYVQGSLNGVSPGIFLINSEVNNPNGGFAYGLFDHNLIYGGISLNKSGDSIVISNTVVQSQTSPAIYANLVNGTGGLAGNLVITGCNLSGSGGSIVIDAAASVQIVNSEIEQGTVNTEANNSIIDILGSVSNVGPTLISGCQIQASASTGNPTLIRFGNCTGAIVDNCRLSTPSAYTHIINTASAIGTILGAGNTFFGGGVGFSDLNGSTIRSGISYGVGAPVFSALKGSLYSRTDGSSTSTRLYINTDGGTTWTNITTAA